MISELDFANLLKKFQAPDNMNGAGPKHYSASNDTPNMKLGCPECGVTKCSTEDLEIHLKIEHLNWIPFQCPVCLTERASDAMMREHIYTNHKNSVNKFIYIDNQEAKKKLQILVDRAIQAEIRKKRPARQSVMANVSNREEVDSPPAEPLPSLFSGNATVKEESPDDYPGEINMDALLARITRPASGESHRFEEESPKSDTSGDDGQAEDPLNNVAETSFALDSLAALFASASNVSTAASSSKDAYKKATPKPETGGKKRASGVCTQCHKSVTAGARQMHIFYHLAKDFQEFRFRCLFEGCSVEHYRKDQMENHQSKMHGRVDHSMMEDRSFELFTRSQDLSMKLLGKNSAVSMAPPMEHKNKGGRSSGRSTPFVAEDVLECQLCNKTMQNRVRGFHILGHLSKDLGIKRYVCVICGFAHERSQSIVIHGKKEHGDDNVLQDNIKEYEEEVNEMSDKCFGLKSAIALEKKRKNEEMPDLAPYSPVAKKKKKLSNGSTEHSGSDEDKFRECSPGEEDDVDEEFEMKLEIEDEEDE